ncbi:hypothetical protein H9P43_006893 [Blastocladiella emersonii ATCC 22665]|nr:hypothetical protein H9P43_006893 [Blastocladiella emersonii ATCC 22665]
MKSTATAATPASLAAVLAAVLVVAPPAVMAYSSFSGSGYYYESGSGPHGEDGCVFLTADMKADRSRWASWCADLVWRWVEIIGGSFFGLFCLAMLAACAFHRAGVREWWCYVRVRDAAKRRRMAWLEREADRRDGERRRAAERAGTLGVSGFVRGPAREFVPAAAPPSKPAAPQLVPTNDDDDDGLLPPPPSYSAVAIDDEPPAAAAASSSSSPEDDAARADAFCAANAGVRLTLDTAAVASMRSARGWELVAPQREVAKVAKFDLTTRAVTFYPRRDPARENYVPRTSPDPVVNVVTNHPVPLHSRTLRPVYIEFELTRLSATTRVTLGLATPPYPSFRRPGRHDWSLALDLWDGRVFVSSEEVRGVSRAAYLPQPFREGDVCGIMVSIDGRVTFSRNGVPGACIDATRVPSPVCAVKVYVAADGFARVTPRFAAAGMRDLPGPATDFLGAAEVVE